MPRAVEDEKEMHQGVEFDLEMQPGTAAGPEAKRRLAVALGRKSFPVEQKMVAVDRLKQDIVGGPQLEDNRVVELQLGKHMVAKSVSEREPAVGFDLVQESTVGFDLAWESAVGFDPAWELDVGPVQQWESSLRYCSDLALWTQPTQSECLVRVLKHLIGTLEHE